MNRRRLRVVASVVARPWKWPMALKLLTGYYRMKWRHEREACLPKCLWCNEHEVQFTP